MDVALHVQIGLSEFILFLTFLLCCVAVWALGLSLLTLHHPPWIIVAIFLLSLHQQWAPTWHPSSVTTNSTEHPLKGVLVVLWKQFFGDVSTQP